MHPSSVSHFPLVLHCIFRICIKSCFSWSVLLTKPVTTTEIRSFKIKVIDEVSLQDNRVYA